MHARQQGFSVVNAIITLSILTVTLGMGWSEYTLWQQRQADSHDKTSLNGLYAYLEKVYYPQNRTYPSVIDETVLQTLPSENRVDASGRAIASQGSNIRYEPSDCFNGLCKNYRLIAILKNETDFIKNGPDSAN